jgi:uncharacterized protein
MHSKIEAAKNEIAQLCQRFGVSRLELFGSAAEDRSNVRDFDFIVELTANAQTSKARRYLALADELEALLGKPVDLLSSASIRNPYFVKSVQRQRIPIYERA